MNTKKLFLLSLSIANLCSFSQIKDTSCTGRDGHVCCWVAEKYSDTMFCDVSQLYRLSVCLEISYDTCQPDAEGWRYSHIKNVKMLQVVSINPNSQMFISYAPKNMDSSNTYGVGSYATDPQMRKDMAEITRVVPSIENFLKKCFIGNPCRTNTCKFFPKRKRKKVPYCFWLMQDYILTPKKDEYSLD